MAFSNQYNFNTVAEAEANWIFTDPVGTGLQATAANSRWTWSNTTTPSGTNTVGPTNGQGGANDGYVYTEASGNPGPSGLEFFAEVDQNFDASTNDIVFSFYRNQTGAANECTFRVQSREGGGAWTDRGQVFGGPGQQTNGTTWVQHTVDMTGLISNSNTRFRIVITIGTTGNIWNNDGAIDTVSIVGTDIVVSGGEAKYVNTITQVSTNSIVSTGFTASHYNDARIVGVWGSSGNYKGMSWIRRFVSTTELELDFPLIDKDGNIVIQEVGDLFQISLNFADLDNATATVTGKTVQILQPIEFGTLNESNSICFYDEAKDVRVTSNLGSYPMRFNGGLIVFGHLYDYDTRSFSNSVNFTSTDDGANGNQLVVFSESAKVWWLGGSLLFQVTPARFPGGGAGGATAAEWQKWWGVSTNADVVSPGGGAPWSNNASSQEFINIDSNPNSNNAIGFRIADGTLLGGSVKISSNNVISPFGADANGNYIIGAEPNERFNVLDLGWNSNKTTFWRSSQARTQTIRANNIITSDRRSGITAQPGSNPLNTAVISFYYSDSYTNVLENTKFSILKSDDSLENTYIADSTGVINGEVLEAVSTGFAENVVDNTWSYNLYLYGYSFISGTFSTITTNTLSGIAKNVELGGLINQVEDREITVNLEAARNITTQEETKRTYDSIMAVFYDNFLTEKRSPITKSGDTIDFLDSNVIITSNTGLPIINGDTITINVGSVGEYTGNLNTTGNVINEVPVNGLINGEKFVIEGEVVSLEYDKVVATEDITITLDGVILPELIVRNGATLNVLGTNNAKAPLLLTETSGTIVLENDLIPSDAYIEDTVNKIITLRESFVENDLSGMRGLLGVSFSVSGTSSSYDLGDYQLIINGELTHNPDTETLSTIHTGNTPSIQINSTGVYNYGVETTANGNTKYSSGTGLIIQGGDTTTTAEWNMSLYGGINVDGGSFIGRGGLISSDRGFGWYNEVNIDIIDTEFVKVGTASRREFRLDNNTPANGQFLGIINGFQISTRSFPPIFSPVILDGEIVQLAFTNSPTLEIVNLDTSGSVATTTDLGTDDLGGVGAKFFVVTNASNGSLTRTMPKSDVGDTRQLGGSIIIKDIEWTINDPSGSPIEAVKMYLEDTDNGFRKNANGQNHLSGKIYEASTNSMGKTGLIKVITAITNIDTDNVPFSFSDWDTNANNNNYKVDRRSINDSGSDEFIFSFYKYGLGYAQSNQFLKGIGILDANWILFPDSSITELDTSVIDSYQTIDNSRQFYDALSRFMELNFVGQDIRVNRAGDDLDLGSNNLIINSSGPALVYAEGVITINSNTFTGNITTTGVVQENTAQVLGSITDLNSFRSNKVITLTGIANPSKVHLFNAGLTPTDLDYEIDTQLVTNGTYSFVFKAGQNITADVRVNNLQNRIIEFNVLLGLNDINIPISQQTDRIYENN